MVYKTEYIEGLTVFNATIKIQKKIEEMQILGFHFVAFPMFGTQRAILIFKV